MSFFNFTEDAEYGNYYSLGNLGYTALIIILLAAIAVAAIILAVRQKKAGMTQKLNSKVLAIAGISLALSFITSFVKFELPVGGSVTLFSMFFICFIGYLYGVKVGFLTAFAFSILEFIQTGGTYFLSPFQVCCDYFFAFTALGVASFWSRKKNGLVWGYIIACLARGFFHTIGGYIYWMDYMPDWFPKAFTSVYSIVYNYSYILAEMIITLVVISLPPVKKALKYIETNFSN